MKTNKCPACNTVMSKEEIIDAIAFGSCSHCEAELDVESINAEFFVVELTEEE